MKQKTYKEAILKSLSGIFAATTAMMTNKRRIFLMPIKKYAMVCMVFLSGSFTVSASPITYDFLGFSPLFTDPTGVITTADLAIDLDGSFVTGSFNYDRNAPTGSISSTTSLHAITNFGFDIHTTSGLSLNMTTHSNFLNTSTSTGWDLGGFGTSSSTSLPTLGSTLTSASLQATVTPIPSDFPTDLSIFSSAKLNLFFDTPGYFIDNSANYFVTSITERVSIIPAGGNTTPPTTTSSVPEPAPLALLGLGLMGLGVARRRRR